MSLLANAQKFTRRQAEAVIEVGSTRRDAEMIYFVRDNGIGFDAEHARQLFRPFHQLRPAEFEGAGIGLVTVRRIIERHGGRVWAEGTPEVGAVFSFSLTRPASR